MYPRAARNTVLFSQLRENGFKCTWTGLKTMAVRELITVCTPTKDEDTLQEGLDLFFEDSIFYREELAHYLLRNACPKLPFNAIDENKFHLLFGLFKNHGMEAFTSLPSLKEVIHEILENWAASGCDVKEVARKLLVEISMLYDARTPHDGVHAVITYLTKHRGADLNAISDSYFFFLVDCLGFLLLDLCSAFSTPVTNVFLHTKLDAKKIDLLWQGILLYLPANLCSGSVDLIRLFIGNGFDIKDALFSINFYDDYVLFRCDPYRFNDLLEIIEIFMDHGARLNTRHRDSELPFLQGILKAHHIAFYNTKTRPKLHGFITKCFQRGVDPKSSYIDSSYHEEDLLLAVSDFYEADDKKQLIEHLCDCGADASLYRNDGLDIWSRLTHRSEGELADPSFNETLLVLLRRGLRTGCIDQDGNNVLHMYFQLYSGNHSFKECCQCGWMRQLDELKFWDVLDALLDAGVQVNHLNKEGETPLDLFTQTMFFDLEDDLETACSECSAIYMDVDQSTEGNLNAEVTRLRKYVDRLSPSSLQPM